MHRLLLRRLLQRAEVEPVVAVDVAAERQVGLLLKLEVAPVVARAAAAAAVRVAAGEAALLLKAEAVARPELLLKAEVERPLAAVAAVVALLQRRRSARRNSPTAFSWLTAVIEAWPSK